MPKHLLKIILFISFPLLYLHSVNAFANDKPYHVYATMNAENEQNLQGGIKTGSANNVKLELGFDMDTSVIHLPKGGTFWISALGISSDLPSQNLIGDFQTASNIESPNQAELYGYYYQQKFQSLPLTLKLGRIDLNASFDATDSAALLMNSGFGISAALSGNANLSLFPKLGYGVILNQHQSKTAENLVGIFKGDPTNSDLQANTGYIAIAEHQQILGQANLIKLGGWSANTKAQNDASYQTVQGLYTSIEIPLNIASKWHPTGFIRAAASQGKGIQVPASAEVGLMLPAPFKSRPKDQFSTGISHAQFNQGLSETSYEMTYSWQFNPSISLQPDLQYIVSPSGNLPNAWVAMLRLNITGDQFF